MSWNEQTLMARMEQIRDIFTASAEPPNKDELCSENCDLCGVAFNNGWWDAWEYGCETDQLYCGGNCPWCTVLMVVRTAQGKYGPDKQRAALSGLRVVHRIVREMEFWPAGGAEGAD